MRVRMSRRAEMDLVAITDFIALDNPERADQFEDELLEYAQQIALAPAADSVVTTRAWPGAFFTELSHQTTTREMVAEALSIKKGA